MRAVRLFTLLAGSVALLSGAAVRHNHLLKSSPANGDSLRASPTEIQLWFVERPELPFTSLTLLRADSSKVAVGKPKPGVDSLEAIVPLPAPLAPGRYTASWRTASADGHAARGSFGFTVSGAN